MTRTPALEDWLNTFVSSSLRDEAVDRAVGMIDGEIIKAIPELGVDPVLVEDLRRSTRHQWMAFLNGLRQSEHGLMLPSQALDLARSLARRSKDVKVLLRVYLNAHRGVFAYLSSAIDEMGGEEFGTELLREVWSRADLWMDESVESLIETFFEERQRELDGSAARRAEILGAILEGGDVDGDVASRELSHPLADWHTGFVLLADEADRRTAANLGNAADAFARCFPGAKLFTDLSGSRDLRGWVTTRKEPDAEALAGLKALDLPLVSLAVGVPALGMAGFRSTHAEARAAQAVAMSSLALPRFIAYRTVEVLCLALADKDGLERMVQREIGPLCAPDKNLEAVRETVLTFLSNRMNVEATAERLYIHGNTVRYRLSKAEELVGGPLAERPRQIELALQYVAHFGAAN